MLENREPPITEAAHLEPEDPYAAWIEAESECERSLQEWFAAEPSARRSAYCVYRAALDREEAAARDLQRRPRSGGSQPDFRCQVRGRVR